VTLPSSLQYASQITLKLDGTVETTSTVGGSGFVQHTDGTWTNASAISTSDVCGLASGGSISMGTHTLQVVDASGNVLAEGTYTLAP
jgi:cold shock CspA family protein